MGTPTSWNGKIPSTATEVAELQNKTFSLRRKGEFGQDFFHDTVLRMMSLREAIKAEEERFYSQFNLPKGPFGLEVLQQRLNELNSDIGFRSMSNLSDSSFEDDSSSTFF